MMKFFEEPDVIVPPDDSHETPPEENLNEQTAFYPGPGEVRSYMIDAEATNETIEYTFYMIITLIIFSFGVL